MNIAFAGVGLMGEPMARRLLGAGHAVRVIAHRNRAPVEALKAAGAREAASIPDLLAGAEIAILCLTSAKTAGDWIAAALPHLSAGQIVVDTGTSGPAIAKTLARDLAARDIRFADAPVTGGPEQAATGELGVLCGADEDVFARIEPVFKAYATRIRRFGPPGAGQAAKLVTNAIVTGMIALVAEGFLTARKEGIGWRDLYEVMLNGSGNSGVLRKMVEPALGGDFDGYKWSLANARKDIGLYRELAEALGFAAPVSQAVLDFFERAVEGGHGGRNVSHLLDPAIDDVS